MLRHNSFRGKLVILSVGVLVCYQLLVLVFNYLFMEPYYLHRVEQSLINAYHSVAEMDEIDTEYLSELEKTNLTFLIADREDFTVLYNTQTPDNMMQDMLGRILPAILSTVERSNTEYFVNTDEVFRESTNDIHYGSIRRVTLGGVTDQYIVDISTAYSSIDQATRISMQFSLLIGLIILLIGAIVYSRLATMFTRPVLQMKGVANKIAHLDFSEKCEVNSDDELGDMARSINTMSDFMQSHIRQLEDANLQLKEDLRYRQEQSTARNNLLANLSHDLKTPIGLISGYADGLRSGMVKTDEEIHEYCDVIVDESDRMMNLIVRMMELFRLESGCVELQPEEFDLADLLNYTVEIFSIEFERLGLHFTADYDDCLYINEDYFAVEQVITNYMQNAVSHVGEGKELRLTVRKNDNSYRVSVFNSALPIPDFELEHIWDSFYRADKSRTRSRRESGLGLSIVRSNMELMGGSYGAQSVDGGVEFWAEFALSPEPISPVHGEAIDNTDPLEL